MMAIKYFIASSYEYPHIYVIFSGTVNSIIPISKGVYKYVFTNCDIIETENIIEKYINNCTFDIKVNKKKIVNLDFETIEEIYKERRTIFTEKYKNTNFITYNKFVFDSYKEALFAIRESCNGILKTVETIKNDIENRIDILDTINT